MDIKEAAKILGVHTQTIYNMVNDGRLSATKQGGKWVISEESVKAILENVEAGAALVDVAYALENAIAAKEKQNLDLVYAFCKNFVSEYEQSKKVAFNNTATRLGEILEERKVFSKLKEIKNELTSEAIDQFSKLTDWN